MDWLLILGFSGFILFIVGAIIVTMHELIMISIACIGLDRRSTGPGCERFAKSFGWHPNCVKFMVRSIRGEV